MEKLDNRGLHLVMYASTKSGVSFQTTRALAIILAASLSTTYLNIASDRRPFDSVLMTVIQRQSLDGTAVVSYILTSSCIWYLDI